MVLRYMARARERGVAVVFVTHNPHHAYAIGDRFVALRRGEVLGDFARSDVHLERLATMMSGGEELERLALDRTRTTTVGRPAKVNSPGQILGEGLFPHQAEGVILYACSDTAGYWLATDQDLTMHTFRVFDRATLRRAALTAPRPSARAAEPAS